MIEPKPLIDKVNNYKINKQGCWIFQGCWDKDGYGRIMEMKSGKNKMIRSNRAAWIVFRGSIPDCKHVLHTCDEPSCVNPEHLYLGTPADNSRDKVARGRMNITQEMRNKRRELNLKNPQKQDKTTGRFIK